jgi:hypothetical protein
MWGGKSVGDTGVDVMNIPNHVKIFYLKAVNQPF